MTNPPDVRYRYAELADCPAVARLHRLSMFAAMPYLPDLHTPAEDLAFHQRVVFPANRVYLAEGGGGDLLGFCAFGRGWVNHLYVRPDAQGRGVGSRLLAEAMGDGDALQLWAFQRNAAARRFYERHGFAVAERTDGAGNDEREPDVRYCWRRPPGQPMTATDV